MLDGKLLVNSYIERLSQSFSGTRCASEMLDVSAEWGGPRLLKINQGPGASSPLTNKKQLASCNVQKKEARSSLA